MTKTIITTTFQTVPRDYFTYLSGRFARRWWWTMVLPLAALLVAAWMLADLRFVILALMLLFIFIPTIATFVWFGNALSREARLSTLPRVVEIRSGEKISIRYPENPAEHSREILWCDIKSIKRGRKGSLVITLRTNARDVVIIPREALNPPDGQ